MRRRIEKLLSDCRRGLWLPAAVSGGVKGGGGVRPEGVVSLSLPSGRVPPSPVQPAPPSQAL